MFPDKVPAVLFDLFTNLPELFHDLFLTAFRPCRIGKIMMEFLGVGREIRTVLAGIVTDADHKVKIDASVFIHVVGRMARNVQAVRSEEHTSELQSLMRISYAVFCLKNNITNIIYITR